MTRNIFPIAFQRQHPLNKWGLWCVECLMTRIVRWLLPIMLFGLMAALTLSGCEST
jgi:hypothetical protein